MSNVITHIGSIMFPANPIILQDGSHLGQLFDDKVYGEDARPLKGADGNYLKAEEPMRLRLVIPAEVYLTFAQDVRIGKSAKSGKEFRYANYKRIQAVEGSYENPTTGEVQTQFTVFFVSDGPAKRENAAPAPAKAKKVSKRTKRAAEKLTEADAE